MAETSYNIIKLTILKPQILAIKIVVPSNTILGLLLAFKLELMISLLLVVSTILCMERIFWRFF